MTQIIRNEPGRKPREVIVRYMDPKDAGAVSRLHRDEYHAADSLTVMRLLSYIKRSTYTPIVMELDGEIIAYAIYDLSDSGLRILHLLVAPEHRHRGHGAVMVEHMKIRLVPDEMSAICQVNEYDLDEQLFLRAQGFRCTQTSGQSLIMEYAG